MERRRSALGKTIVAAGVIVIIVVVIGVGSYMITAPHPIYCCTTESTSSETSATTPTSFSNTTSSSTTCHWAGCGPPGFWVNYNVNGTVPVISKFNITQGTSYSISVPAATGVTFTFFGNGVISLPTMVCNGSNCPSQIINFLQYQTCSPGALFCPSGDELTTINFMMPGSYSLVFSYQTTPGGPLVSNSLTVLAVTNASS